MSCDWTHPGGIRGNRAFLRGFRDGKKVWAGGKLKLVAVGQGPMRQITVNVTVGVTGTFFLSASEALRMINGTSLFPAE